MQIIEREHIDANRWDELVREAHGMCFSYSWYMDAVAENWCVLVDEDYRCGIALPYTKRAGVELLYTPIFGRYSELLGEIEPQHLQKIKDRFKVIEFACRQDVFGSGEERVNQVITDFEHHKFGSQAKRMIKKAVNKNGFTCLISDDFEPVYQSVFEELKGKHQGINEVTLNALHSLFTNAKSKEVLKVFQVRKEENVLGGIVCFELPGYLIYIKGAVDEETKTNGGMYLALSTAIDYARENNLFFDFGGSNADGVRRFNLNLGGVDTGYYMHIENNGPAWFKLAKRLKNALR